MYTHRTLYTHGDTVYLKTDPAQLKRIVLAINIRINNVAYYELGCGPESSFHFDFEMTTEPDKSIQLGINQ